MKLARFSISNAIHWGVLSGTTLDLIDGDVYSDWELSGRRVELDTVTLLAPCTPTKAVCVGLNYYDHAREMNLSLPAEPLLFLKPSSTLAHPGGFIEYPTMSENVHFEAELAVIIKKQAKKIPAAAAYDYVLGYTCANDITARDLQLKDGQWTRGKSFDTFLPVGPWVETAVDPHTLTITLEINGALRQHSNTSNLIFKVPELIAHITQVMTLYPGDCILTGTPPSKV
ncbi:MAG: ureidoglycolate lyase [Firmicutes bacterium]|nr:ureidoglycolate lyase [Bacillota bacterium]